MQILQGVKSYIVTYYQFHFWKINQEILKNKHVKEKDQIAAVAKVEVSEEDESDNIVSEDSGTNEDIN